ncbi:hypothetical protein ESCAB7627_4012 [Escherichia albertii TW07627]|uniref:Uncharacterized protein n=1 Tax=Escherichia albertii (strain TW07627) TaxID=502347 RepID=A0ABC9NJA1_ESCAT|nr:hypothetical protein ESCAB7627_4012 [Escherichia albertii TW07627]
MWFYFCETLSKNNATVTVILIFIKKWFIITHNHLLLLIR